MMAGTNPSMIVTPYDAPGAPLGALTYYIGYASGTGVVSLYGLNPQGPASSDIELSSGQTLAPGTSPSIVSSLNWVDGEQVVFDGETGANWQTTLAPAAAMNAYVGELYLPGTPGLSDATPLTRGNPANSDPNRAVTCAGFNAFPAGNIYGVTSDSCDEYPFASSQQSGGALGIAGSSCLEIVSAQGTNGSWTFSMLNRYSAVYPQVCLRGHVNSTLNSSVGSLELNPLYINDRMMIGDPYTVQVTS
jgi:hypothetical protein